MINCFIWSYSTVAKPPAEPVQSQTESDKKQRRNYRKPAIVWEDDLVSKVGLSNGCAKVSEHPLCSSAPTS